MTRIAELFNYSPPISIDEQEMYESALMLVPRWEGGLYVTDREENDKEHVIGMFDIHEENRWKYPNLISELDDYDVMTMFYVHDGGELVVKDLAADRPDIAQIKKRWKRKEELAFHLIVASKISDPKSEEFIRGRYRRYVKRDPHDKEAGYADLVDKVQATRFGKVHVFPGSRLDTKSQQQQKLNFCFDMLLSPAKRLYSSVSPDGAKDVKDFVWTEFESFIKAGYRRPYVEYYLNQFNEHLVSSE